MFDSDDDFEDEEGFRRYLATRATQADQQTEAQAPAERQHAAPIAVLAAVPPPDSPVAVAGPAVAQARHPAAAALPAARPSRKRAPPALAPPSSQRPCRENKRPPDRYGTFAVPQRDFRVGHLAYAWRCAGGYTVSWIHGGVPAPLLEEGAGRLRLLCDGEPVLGLRIAEHGLGVFACRELQPLDVATAFQGPLVAEGDHDGEYGMRDPRGRGVLNPRRADLHLLGHFFNHSTSPNCRVGHDLSIRAAHKIPAGTELTIDYGDEYEWTADTRK